MSNIRYMILVWIIPIHLTSFAQNRTKEAFIINDLHGLEKATDFYLDDDFFYCLGYRYKKDRKGIVATLYKFDLELNEIWSITIDSTHYNRLDHLTIYKDQIFVTGFHGVAHHVFPTEFDRYIYSITKDGIIKRRSYIGKSSKYATNIVGHKRRLWVAYTEPEGRCIIASYDYTNHRVQHYVGQLLIGSARHLIKVGQSFMAFSDSYNNLLITKLKGNVIEEKHMTLDHWEYHMDVEVLSKNNFIVYSRQFKNLIKTTIDFKFNVKETYKFNAPPEVEILLGGRIHDGDLWLYVQKNQAFSLLRLNETGMPQAEYQFGAYLFWNIEIIDNGFIEAGNNMIRIVDQPPTPIMSDSLR